MEQQAANNVNDDLLVEILTKLPLKSFSRSKCVSKSWHALISDDHNRSKLRLVVSGVFQRHSSEAGAGGPYFISSADSADDGESFHTATLQPDSFPFKSSAALIDCCNGLLLFYSSNSILSTSTYYVCNPITKQYVTLPKSTKTTNLSILAFDPCHSRHYRVVSFVAWHDRSADVEIFDSQSGRWGLHRLSWGIDTNSLSTVIRCIGGIMYIVSQTKQLLAVDLDRKICRLIGLPEGFKEECCVARVGGRLRYGVKRKKQVMVWELKDEGRSEWELKHCVGLKSGGGNKFRVMALDPKRESVVYLLVEGELWAYDVVEEKAEGVWSVRNGEEGYLVQVSVFPFTRDMEGCLAR